MTALLCIVAYLAIGVLVAAAAVRIGGADEDDTLPMMILGWPVLVFILGLMVAPSRLAVWLGGLGKKRP